MHQHSTSTIYTEVSLVQMFLYCVWCVFVIGSKPIDCERIVTFTSRWELDNPGKATRHVLQITCEKYLKRVLLIGRDQFYVLDYVTRLSEKLRWKTPVNSKTGEEEKEFGMPLGEYLPNINEKTVILKHHSTALHLSKFCLCQIFVFCFPRLSILIF